MSAPVSQIVVSYNLEDGNFHRESVKEYTQGNALRLLKDRAPRFHAVAIVETMEAADDAVAAFSKFLRVVRDGAAVELKRPADRLDGVAI